MKNEHGLNCRVIDLHWMLPVAGDALVREVSGCDSVLVVEECRKTGSLSEQLVTLLVERLSPLPNIRVHAAEDSFIPLGATATVTLPSRESIVEAALASVKKSRGTAKKPSARSKS